MDAFRNLLKGWFGKVLLALFILPFAFFGIEGLFMSGGRSDVAIQVNGDEITQREITQRIDAQRQNIMQRMGGMDSSMITDDIIRPGVERTLIQQRLLAQAVEKDFYAPQELVRRTIREIPQLQDEDGQFSEFQFRLLLQRAGYTGAGFLEEVAMDLRRNQLRAGIESSAFVSPDEVKYLLNLDRQTRDISITALTAETFLTNIQPNEAEIESNYQQNQFRFRTPEQAKINYLVFSAQDMPINEPTAEDIEFRYQSQAAAAGERERRRAQHILIEAEPTRSKANARSKITSLQAELAEGKDFDTVAREHSDDAASARLGGDLGFAGRGLYDTAFEDALFALREGEVSSIVETEFGFHLIRLSGIEMVDVEPLDDERRAKLLAELRAERGRHALNEAMDHINRLAFESGDLHALADEYKLEIQSSDWLQREPTNNGILANERLLQSVFTEQVLIDRENSDVIDVDADTLVVLRVTEHQPAAVKALSDVRDQIVESLKLEEARRLALEKAEDIVTKLEAGEDILALAEAHGLNWDIIDAVERQNPNLDSNVIRKVFEMPRPAEGGVTVARIEQGRGDQAIILLRAVNQDDMEYAANELAQVGMMLSQRYGSQDFNYFMESLEKNATIKRK